MPISLIVDDNDTDLPGDTDNTIKLLREAVTSDPAPADPVAPEPSVKQTTVPAKYQGKSIEEVVEMHRNLESLYGRLANDLGQQRKLTDQLLEIKRKEDLAANTPTLPEITSGDLLDNPAEALDKFVEAKTKGATQEALDRLSQLEATLAQERFMSRHSDVNEIASSEEFNTWLSRSPLRMQYAQAAAQGDWTSADLLLNEYKDYQVNARQSSTDNTSSAAIEAARAASLEGVTAAPAGGAKPTGKIYRRVDLIDLKMRKPEVYGDPEFQREIVRAYQEGRVK